MARTPQRATFQRQALWIALPVMLLAAFGGFSLFNDWRFVETEARDRAQMLADSLAQQVIERIKTEAGAGPAWVTTNTCRFQLNPDGSLREPKSYSKELVPLNPQAMLDSTSSALLDRAQELELVAERKPAAAALYKELLAGELSPEWRALVSFRLGVIESDPERGLEFLESSRLGPPDQRLESGTPLQAIVALKLIDLAIEQTNRWRERAALADLCSNAVSYPTLLTARVLEQAEVLEASISRKEPVSKEWLRVWKGMETSREVFRQKPAEYWLELNSTNRPISTRWVGSWLMVGGGFTTQPWPGIFGITTERLNQIVAETIQGSSVPKYFTVQAQVADKQLALKHAPPAPTREGFSAVSYQATKAANAGTVAPESATQPVFAASKAELPVQVQLSLIDRAGLFEREKHRTIVFGSLLIATVLAAGLGLRALWLSFQQQVQLSEMKSNFVSAVSHELRAPIASVRLMAENLERGKIAEPQKQREYFSFIVQECRRLSSLIENVLDFARIEQGRKQFEFEPTDVSTLVSQTIKIMEPIATERGISICERQSLPTPAGKGGAAMAPGPTIHATLDGQALQQALVNLIDNAIKFSPARSTVTLGLEASGDAVLISVEDQGCGIPPDEHEKIFERFYRRGTEMRRESQGVGIGLSLVKHIVEAHHGKITVHSEAGKGSRFVIELPRERHAA